MFPELPIEMSSIRQGIAPSSRHRARHSIRQGQIASFKRGQAETHEHTISHSICILDSLRCQSHPSTRQLYTRALSPKYVHLGSFFHTTHPFGSICI